KRFLSGLVYSADSVASRPYSSYSSLSGIPMVLGDDFWNVPRWSGKIAACAAPLSRTTIASKPATDVRRRADRASLLAVGVRRRTDRASLPAASVRSQAACAPL